MEKANKQTNNKFKINIIIYILLSVLFAMPSIIYLIRYKTVYKFTWVWTYFFRRPVTQNEKLLNALVFFALFSFLFLIYYFIMKNHKKIFQSKKAIFLFIILISILFTLVIPYTSLDVYSYIANGWSAGHYGENPYYVSIAEISQKNGVSDPMFNKVANCWRNETVVYGPLWTIICTCLSWLSFGNIDIALLIFKIVNLIVHLINCLLIYKITKKNLFVILYGLNPFILFEALTNVHNDIFIILFVLLAIYFVRTKKNLFIAVGFVATATAIKYLAILILPFIVLYAVRDKSVKERILCCIFSGIEYIAIIALFYVFYLKDLNVLAGIFIQQGKYNRSIFYLLYELLKKDVHIISIIQYIVLGIFAIYYIYRAVHLLMSKEINFYNSIQKYHFILMIFTFILITNFNPWYIMWLFPTIFFIRGKSIKNVLNLSYASEIANFASFALWSEEQYLGVPYFIIMILLTVILNRVKNKKKGAIYEVKN